MATIRFRKPLPVLAYLFLLAGLAACSTGARSDLPDAPVFADVPDVESDAPGDVPGDVPADVPDDVPDASFDVIQLGRDHTLPSFATLADFLAFAGPGRAPAQVKFILRDFQGPNTAVHFEEPGFYEMHDAWSWYSLLNGIPIPGYDFLPLTGHSFATVTDAVNWAVTQANLPWDLTFVEGERLYSPHFYELAFNTTGDDGEAKPRFFGCGSVMHYDADPRRPLPDETWVFELEYTDYPTPEDVTRFFELLSAALPEGAGDRLLWLVRSPWQAIVAGQMDTAGGPLAHRFTTYSKLLVPGDSQTYNPGIAAGRVRIVEPGESIATLSAQTVLVLKEIPDDVPPVAAIVTAIPQTPLAHIGLLARARGTPNLYVAGVADDPQVQSWDSYARNIVVQATETGHRFREMTQVEWSKYQSLLVPRQTAIDPVDVSTIPETFDPLAGSMAQMPELVTQIGGKTAGFLVLNAVPELDIPDRPFGLTVKGYAEFLARIDPPVASILARPEMEDPRVQLAVLEGPTAYLSANGNSASAVAWMTRLQQDHAGDVLGRALGAGGLRQLVMTTPMDAAYLERVTTALGERFAFLAPFQGLRFRSSSSAEDVEGFNGAGLYESHTGYLHPELQKPKNQSKTVEDAIRRVWSSYWLYGAFREREQAGIDSLAANMGVLVHPVFDDDLEAANGVLTLELVRRPQGDVVTLTANAQKGALSVTNPPPGSTALPEVDVVRRVGAAAATVERQRASTEVPTGEWLLDEARLLGLADVLAGMASDWMDLRNAVLPAPQQRSSLTVDLEFKRMSAGWPARADGATNPERFVIKQARTLEQPVRATDAVRTMPVPRDVLAQAVQVQRRSCLAGALELAAIEFLTDPTNPWPFDFGVAPFDAYFVLQAAAEIPGFPFVPGKAFALMHTQVAASHPGMAAGGPWTLDLAPTDPATAGFTRLVVGADGAWSLQGAGGASVSGTGATCTVEILVMSPQAYLKTLMGP